MVCGVLVSGFVVGFVVVLVCGVVFCLFLFFFFFLAVVGIRVLVRSRVL